MDNKDIYIESIKVLSETIWEQQPKQDVIEAWLGNFNKTEIGDIEKQKLHALYLLSQFMYFGVKEIRELLRYLYLDIYKYPIIREIRKSKSDTLDIILLEPEFKNILSKTRFLSLGNPSESSSLLLYYFRQENKLPKNIFLDTSAVFMIKQDSSGNFNHELANPDINHYIFIDDYCGSGQQVINYLEGFVPFIKTKKPDCKVSYYSLFATKKSVANINKRVNFDELSCIFELDKSFECFSDESRYFIYDNDKIDKDFAKKIFIEYGTLLCPGHPLGFANGQKLIGFHYNTPDNTLPAIWYNNEDNKINWSPVFKRYNKIN